MTIREIIRNRLPAVLLSISVILGFAVPSFFNTYMDKEKGALDDLYRSIDIRCNLIPQEAAGKQFSLDVVKGLRIRDLEGVGSFYCEIRAPIRVLNTETRTRNFMAIGTNSWLEYQKEHEIDIQIDPAYQNDPFDQDVCFINTEFSEMLGLDVSDEISVCGIMGLDSSEESNITRQLKIIGTYTSIDRSCILCPYQAFSGRNAIILADEIAIETYRNFTAFHFTIDPSYNRQFETVKDKAQAYLGKEWRIYSTSKEIYQAARPMEERLSIQESFGKIISLLFPVLPALISFFLLRTQKNNILIRRIHGEGGKNLFVEYTSSVLLIETVLCVLAGILVKLFVQISLHRIFLMFILMQIISMIIFSIYSFTDLINLYSKSNE